MGWLPTLLLIISAVCYAVSSFFDNFITDTFFRGRRPEAQKVFSIIFYAIVITFLIIFSPPTDFNLFYVLLLAGSGVADAIAGIFYYRSLVNEETTGVTIIMQFLPVFSLVSGFFILGDEIAIPQLVAIALLLLSAVLIVFSHGKSRSRTRVQLRTIMLLLIAMVFWTTATTIFAFAGDGFDFMTSFFYVMLGHFISNLVLALVMKSWRVRARNVFREFRFKIIVTYLSGNFIWLVGEALWCLSILSAPIAVASAVSSTSQLIVTFILGLVLTTVLPRFGREKLTGRTVSYHLVALLLSIAAILLIQLA